MSVVLPELVNRCEDHQDLPGPKAPEGRWVLKVLLDQPVSQAHRAHLVLREKLGQPVHQDYKDQWD